MTRFLKLVKNEDGKWKALSAEADDLSEEVSIKEKTYAPIDPHQLLKALDNHLSTSGGIKSVKDVPRLASLMKKFSRKLVSRCVYCNVLQATEPDILSEYLDKGGWETINLWLQYAKTNCSGSFLLEMLKLCKQLPMSLERLKENNTAKLIKSLTKHENEDVKTLSTEVVTKWMSIIKEKKGAEAVPGEKKKKKEKSKHESEKSVDKTHAKAESPKGAGKIKGVKRPSSEKEKETKKVEYYEDVKIDPEPLLPVAKKPKQDRPKTAKIYQKKFRATGLEEETPLPPKTISKKTNVDKTSVAAAKTALKISQPSTALSERVLEKKIKPESLMTINETSTANKGIKLIPAKPKPTYILHESASFMDALISQPAAPVKRRKKVHSPKATNSPTSPTLTPPKLQFYKDTLEMSEDSKKEEGETASNEENAKSDDQQVSNEGDEPMDVSTEEGGRTPPNNDSSNTVNMSEENEGDREEFHQKSSDPNQLRSILSHGRRRGNKKSVKWVEDANIKEVFYFELDETERVNVLRTQNFGDMKSIELKREREALELAKRQAGDKMEEMIRWWAIPVLIDLPPPLIEPGCQSREREIEKLRQQSTLQEIYFTREMIPDSPHEPDLEIVPPQEAKIIPRDEENLIGHFLDHSNVKIKSLPDVLSTLSSLVKTNRTLLPLPNNEQVPNELNLLPPSLINPGVINPPNASMSLSQPYDPAEPTGSLLAQSGMMGGSPPIMPNVYNILSPSDTQNVPPPADWQSQFFSGNFQMNVSPEHIPSMNQGFNQMPPMENPMIGMNQNPAPNQVPNMNQGPNINQEPNMNSGPNMNHGPGMNQGPPMRPRIMQDSYRPHRNPPRGAGPRGGRHAHRVPCRHFLANGCRFGMKCTFLHPGVNGPRL